MAADFALFLSPEGIALAHRQDAGHWAFVGETRVDVDDLSASLAELRATGEARCGKTFETILILPDDQILYTSLMAPTADTAMTLARIEDGLDGLTPYPVAELVYDYRAVEADRVKLAVVAKETLEEARSFADGHGFAAAGFAAMPPLERFPGVPVFGSSEAIGLDGEALVFGPDNWGKPKVAEPKQAPAPTPSPAPEVQAEEPSTPVVPAAPAAPAEPETAPEPSTPAEAETAATPELEPTPPAPKADEAPAATAATPPADLEPEVEAAASTEPVSEPADAAPTPPAPPKPDREPQAQTPKPEPEAAAEEPPTPPEPTASAAPEQPAPPKRPVAAKPKSDAPAKKAVARSTSDADEEAGKALSFSARRGKAEKSATQPGRIVGPRSSRLGFGGEAAAKPGPVLHPDATPDQAQTPQAPTPPSAPLNARLTRLRDAAKPRSRTEPDAPSEQPQTPTFAAPLGARAPDQPAAPRRASTPFDAAPSRSGLSGLSSIAATGGNALGRIGGAISAGVAGLAARRSSAETELDGGQSAPPPTADASLTSGLLARKPVASQGPSFKTGLILTVILLVLLAAVAIWSVLFLPDSPMARLFSGTADEVAVEDPLDAPEAPSVASLPPAMGSLDSGDGTDDVSETVATDIAVDTDTAEGETFELASLEDPDAALDAVGEVIETEIEQALPDIDADIELPPLPPLPEDLLPSLEEAQALYEQDEIWTRTPDRPALTPFDITEDVYVASIDPEIADFDAIALPPSGVDPFENLRRIASPPRFGADLSLDERGLVEATPEGVVTPEGAFVIAGAPPVAAVPRPREVETAAPVAETPAISIDVEDAILGTFRPTARPEDLTELRERQLLGGLSVTELAGLRPSERPLSAQEAAAQASLFPDDDESVTPAVANTFDTATALAIAASPSPPQRPGNIAAIVAAAVRAPAEETVEAVPAAAVAAAPQIPSNTSVAAAATDRNEIRLRNVNLIGVTGTPSDRRAMVRLPSGRFVRVGVGDRLDGGRVAAIGETTLQYVRNGRNITLEIPG